MKGINLNKNNWQVFDNWQIIKTNYSWLVFDQVHSKYEQVINYKKQEYLKLLEKWNVKLEYLGKDPTNTNWGNFRPLRLSREEDWSDWLAFLIEKSKTGFFSQKVFNIEGFNQNNYILPKKVFREVDDYSKSYRADIVIQWNNKNFTHFEIKIGDPNLLKVFRASERFQKTFKVSDTNWTNYILILPSQISNWENTKKLNETNTVVFYLTWEQISILLRKSLFTDETITWKVWAYSFIGIIEQKLLKLDEYWNMKYIPTSINKKIELLEKSLENE